MCGIVGEVSFKAVNSSNWVKNALNSIKHRGPDNEGIWCSEDKKIIFGHRRLSIIDLSKDGTQPMHSECKNYVITFNGEIYNYKDLRRRLEGNFRTNSDTEVILKAYQKWGKECVKYFRGMFSFALWDESQNELFCARDHFGIKPFYY